MVLAFGNHRLDIERRELRRGNESVPIEPKVFDLLAFLVQHRDRVLSKDDLLQGDMGRTDRFEVSVDHADQRGSPGLGDDGKAQRLIRTFTRKGVRFVGEVIETATEVAPAPSRTTVADAPFGLAPPTDKPSIAVLPFQNMSDDPEQEYFADGMVEEITTAIARCAVAVRHRPQLQLHLQGQEQSI